MSKQMRKTNQYLVDTIDQLKSGTRDSGAAIWRDVALRLESSRKNWAQPNLSRLTQHMGEADVVLVPGKLLGSGMVDQPVTVAAWSVSATAHQKVLKAGGRVLTLLELMNENPSGKGVLILG